MKKIKLILSFIFLIAVAISCTVEGIDENVSFLGSVTSPSNVVGFYNVTTDNTGNVTITPNGDGAVSYDVYYGDNTLSPVNVIQGKNTSHIYKEGTYNVKIVAIGITGEKTEVTQKLVVSFKAPENLVVEANNDLSVSKKVNVKATADFAIMFDVYFGEAGNDVPVSANNSGTASYTYKEAGSYSIRIVSKSAAIQTTSKTIDVNATAISQPIALAPAQPNRALTDVISIYSAKYDDKPNTNYFPDWGQGGQGSSWAEFNLNGDKMLQYIKLSYQGIALADGLSLDVSKMEFLHMDVWTADVSRIETSLISKTNGEKPVWSTLNKDQWTSIDIPVSAFTSQGLTVADIHQLKFVGDGWAAGTVFIDNIYFYKAPTPSTGVEGTWKLASEPGALKVGPSFGNGDWWTINAQQVTERACYFDDTYVFSSNGAFSNVQGASTWLESWQGVASEECGSPVSPYDGKSAATYLYDKAAGTIKVNGSGAYLGLPKANNAGELPKVAVPSSITYNVVLSDNDRTMNVSIEAGSGVFWSYKLVKI